MHITRWLALVGAVALGAACTAGGAGRGRDPLEHDAALAALEQHDQTEQPTWVAGAVVCPAAPHAQRPTAAQQVRAARLLELGKGAALAGNTVGAQDLLRQAAYLDGTSAVTAYQLARASETAGDTTLAVREYCRFLSFGASGPERDEVRQRLLLLAPRPAAPSAPAVVVAQRIDRPASGIARASAPRPAASRARSAAVIAARPARTEPPVAESETQPSAPSAVTYDGHADGSVVTKPDSAERTEPASARPAPAPVPRSEPTRTTARDAAIGAMVGAAAGAVVSRDAKGAIVGGAAGGILGAIISRSPRGASRP